MELEEAIKILEDIKDGSNICLTIELEREEKNKEEIEHYENEVKAIETILQALDNSIPKEKVEDKIEIYKRLELESFNRDSIQADEYRAIIKVL